MKILTVVGARPQFVKAATVSRAMNGHATMHEVLVHTGQHYDANMSEIFFQELGIPQPHYNLGIGGGTHGEMTGRQLEAIEQLLIKEKPDWMLVYGDTNSTLAGALAAVKLHIPVAHVEAGLRSHNRKMPEEINRILTDHASDLLFAPTDGAVKNLHKEGIAPHLICQVGDVMNDATLFYKSMARQPQGLDAVNLLKTGFVLATVHRAENTDDPQRLQAILNGLGQSDQQVLIPLHPRTALRMAQASCKIPSNIQCIDPVGYLEMVWLEMHATLIATDSGGVQKEAYYMEKPCVTLRAETEWTELVECGANVLVDADADRIAAAMKAAKPLSVFEPLYGDGRAAEKIIDVLLSH